MSDRNRVWLITGVSGGLGRALAKEAALSGDTVIGTLRSQEQAVDFDELVLGKTFGVVLDVNQHAHFEETLNTINLNFGQIDILVNNAGYGLLGAIEEVSIEEARKQMETNFFAALALTKAILPFMRQKKSGHIIQISSIAGVRSVPGMGIYNAAKFALEGFSEALSMEVKHLNIKVTIIEPGPFRTNWASSAVRAVNIIDDYEPSAGSSIAVVQQNEGMQPGDPEKAARAIVEISRLKNPPLRLPLGTIALEVIRNKIQSVTAELNAWESLIINTSFNEGS